MNREELEEVFNRVYVGQFKKNEKRKVDGSKTLDRNYFSRFRRVSDFSMNNQKRFILLEILDNFLMVDFYDFSTNFLSR